MGVDIHFVREKRERTETGKVRWVSAESWKREDSYLVTRSPLHLHNKVLLSALSGGEHGKGVGSRGYPIDLSPESRCWIEMWNGRATPFDHSFLSLEELQALSRFINQGIQGEGPGDQPMGFSVLHDAYQEVQPLNLHGRAVVEVKGWVKKEAFAKFEAGGGHDYSLIYPLSSYVSPSTRHHYQQVEGDVPLWFVVRDELNKLIAWVKEAGNYSRVLMLKTN